MLDTMTRYLEAIMPVRHRNAIRSVASPLIDRYSSQPLTSAGLVIKTGGSTLAKTGSSAFYAVASGVLVTIAGSTDMTALTGLSIVANSYNVAAFFVDSASVVTVAFGTSGTTLALVKWPQFPAGKALIGFLIITHSSTFTGGTTALDTATTVYVSPLGPFDPTALT